MLRKVVCALFVAVVGVGILLADEVKGKVEKVDADKGAVSVKIEGKDKAKTFSAKNAKIVDKDGKEVKDGVKGIKEGADVTVTYEKGADKKVTVQKIQVNK